MQQLLKLKEKLSSTTEKKSVEENSGAKNAKNFVKEFKIGKAYDTNKLGFEYDRNIKSDEDYYKKIFESGSYSLKTKKPQESLFGSQREILSDVTNFNDVNIPKAQSTAKVGGFPAFSSTISKDSPSRTLELTLERYVIQKLGEKATSSEGLEQEEFYIVKLKWLIKMAKAERLGNKYNLNKLRLEIEKIIEETSSAFDTQIFSDSKQIIRILRRLCIFLLKVETQKAILLSYKLFKMHLKQLDVMDPSVRKEVAIKFHDFFLPYIRLIEIKETSRIGILQKKKENLVTYKKIKKLAKRPEIESILQEFPDPKESTEYKEKFKAFLKEKVTLKQALADLVKAGEYVWTFSRPEETKNDDAHYQIYSRGDSLFGLENAKSFELDENNDELKLGNYYFDEKCQSGKGQYDDRGESESQSRWATSTNRPATDSSEERSSNEETNENEFLKEVMANPDLYEQRDNSSGGTLNEKQESSHKKMEKLLSKDEKAFGLAPKTVSTHQIGNVAVSYERVIPEAFKTHEKGRRPITSLEDIDIKADPIRVVQRPDIIRVNSFDNSRKTPEKHEPPKESSFKKQLLKSSSICQKELALSNTKKEIIFQKVLSIAYDNKSKWDFVTSNQTIKIEKIKPENSPVVLLRAWAFLEGFTPAEVFSQIYDTKNRSKWDTVTTDLQVVESIDEQAEIIYFYIRTPFGVTERDFVQRRDFVFDYPEPETIVMSFQSCTHPLKPPLKNRIRAETHIAGYVIKPSVKKPNSTDLCILSQVDIKGSVPKIIVNMVAGKAPAEWVHKLLKACTDARTSKKSIYSTKQCI